MKIKFLITFFNVFSIVNCYSQKISFEGSINGTHSFVHRVFAGGLDHFHYELKPKKGLETKFHIAYPLTIFFKRKIILTGNIGYRNFNYHGRHYVGLLQDTPNPIFRPRQYEWSTYHLDQLLFSSGLAYKVKNYKFSLSFQSTYLLNASERRQEVHLTESYNGNLFFDKKKHKASQLFNTIDVGIFPEIDYKIYKKIYLNISSYIGLNSISRFKRLDYKYNARTIGLGLKYSS